jgi:hypothetical protein
MKNLVIIFCTVFCTVKASGQLSAFQLQRPLLKTIPVTEKVMQGKKFNYNFNITVAKDYFPGAALYKLANPLVYYRPDDSNRIEVTYFYSIADNIVRLVEYSYDRPANDSTILKQRFAANDSSFTTWFKKPPVVSSELYPTWWQQMSTWQNESVYVKQFIVIGENTYRLRVLVSWKNKPATK